MKIFITGIKGQLGQDCMQVLGVRHVVTGADLPDVDIADRENLNAALNRVAPDAIINCAAYTNVDGCESNREAAHRANGEGAHHVAVWAASRGCRLIHISTDYVFDGSKPVPQAYREEDAPAPASYYGVTKWEGEQAVQAACPAAAILRTAWLYGFTGRNFIKIMLKLGLSAQPSSLKVVDDQFGSPTWSWRLAQQIERVLASDVCGVFHASAAGWCSRFECTQYLFERMAITKPCLPCKTVEFPTAAVLPVNSILENARLKAAGLDVFPDWREDMDVFLRQHGAAWVKEIQQGART
jgi:dTDP-4-dehydrorhamnose reductase